MNPGTAPLPLSSPMDVCSGPSLTATVCAPCAILVPPPDGWSLVLKRGWLILMKNILSIASGLGQASFCWLILRPAEYFLGALLPPSPTARSTERAQNPCTCCPALAEKR